MHKRALLCLVLAGCADPQLEPTLTQAVGPAAPPPPVVMAQAPPPVVSGDPNFDAWLQGFKDRAVAAGVPSVVVERELSGLTPDVRASNLDSKQPEFSKPVGDYVKGAVTDSRVVQGRQFRGELSYLGAMEQTYGVPRDVVLAVWAMESAFGKIQGDMDVVRSLATLAADGRRRAWAEGELIAALKIIASGEQSRARLKGSWAGAMGQTQFLPGVYRSTAVDGDGDGRRDIWGSTADALYSTANYLAKAGWKPGESWSREVALPTDFDFGLTEQPREPLAVWINRGLRRADGRPWSAADQASTASLILPSGASGPAFLIFPNHAAIMKYNNSTAYALGVGLLAKRFGGEDALRTPWPVETPLSRADRIAAQESLMRLGYDTGGVDGAIGPNSRIAIRAWQKANGQPADGYLTPQIIQQMRDQAARQ